MSSKKPNEVLHTQARTIVASVIQYFYLEKHNMGPVLDVRKVLERVSAACGVPKRTVTRINAQLKLALSAENEETSTNEQIESLTENTVEEEACAVSATKKIKILTPRKTPGRQHRERRVTGIDEFGKSAIRRHILQYYERQEVPTLEKLKTSLKNVELFDGGQSSLYKVIRDLGFVYKKFNHRRILMEKSDIALLRCQFLRKIQNVDIENVVFLDETWLNENVHHDKGWTNDTIKGTLKAPLGKGKRLIICHAGSKKGWISAPPLVFESKKTGDYHEEMDHNVFENWFFNTLLPAIPPASTIVMDNASYHSRKKDKAPTSSSTKSTMIQWLQERKVQFRPDLRKPELYQIVKLHKPPVPTYVIDSKATELGFKVIRLPPYHCQYNAIEMVWSNLKSYVKGRNKTFKLKDVKELFFEAVDHVSPDMWSKYIDHVKKIMDADWNSEGLSDKSVQEFIINLCPGDDDSDSESDSEDDSSEDIGCFPLSENM